MRKLTKGLLIAITVVSMGWSILSSLYTHTVSERLTELKRESNSDVIYLRYRIRELESELTAGILDRLSPSAEPVDGDAETTADTELPAVTEKEPATESAGTEAVTLPTHQSPETQVPTASETEAPTALYLLAEHEGIIGVFDASGELLRTLNVFVMTLPEADREALAVGIPAHSWQEMNGLIEQYE